MQDYELLRLLRKPRVFVLDITAINSEIYISVDIGSIIFWCHRSSSQPSVAVLSRLLVQRPGTPCGKI